MAKQTSKIKIEVVSGVQSVGLYIDEHRVAGSKPLGGGQTIHAWSVNRESLINDFRQIGLLSKVDATNQRIDELESTLKVAQRSLNIAWEDLTVETPLTLSIVAEAIQKIKEVLHD